MGYEALTNISRNQWDVISEDNLTPSEAVEYFENKFEPRTFHDILKLFYTGEDLAGYLTQKLNGYDNYLRRIEGKADTAAESTRRKINNWLNEKNAPGRIDWIKICFALGLDDKQADKLMKYNEEGLFHVREPIESVFLYFLKTGRTFEEAHKFISDNSIKLYETNNFAVSSDKAEYTKLVKEDFDKVTGDMESFFEFLELNKPRFGSLHNRAYRHFRDFYDRLANPLDPVYESSMVRGSVRDDRNYVLERELVLSGKDKYKELYGDEDADGYGKKSCTEIVREYLWLGLKIKHEYQLRKDKNSGEYQQKLNKYDNMKKMIYHLTDDETIRSMLRRERDVTRQVLMMMYVMTQGMTNDIYSYEDLDEDLTPADLMEEHAERINLMLYESGFGGLDPRNKLDWVILYSLRVDLNDDETWEEDNPLFERLKSIFEQVQLQVREIAVPSAPNDGGRKPIE